MALDMMRRALAVFRLVDLALLLRISRPEMSVAFWLSRGETLVGIDCMQFCDIFSGVFPVVAICLS